MTFDHNVSLERPPMRGLSDAYVVRVFPYSLRASVGRTAAFLRYRSGTSIALREPREFDLAHGQNDKVGL